MPVHVILHNTEGQRLSIASVAAGFNSTAVVTSSGELFTWGNGRHGRLYKDRRFRPRLAQLRASRPALYQHPVLLIDAAGRGVCNITTLGKLLDPG